MYSRISPDGGRWRRQAQLVALGRYLMANPESKVLIHCASEESAKVIANDLRKMLSFAANITISVLDKMQGNGFSEVDLK